MSKELFIINLLQLGKNRYSCITGFSLVRDILLLSLIWFQFFMTSSSVKLDVFIESECSYLCHRYRLVKIECAYVYIKHILGGCLIIFLIATYDWFFVFHLLELILVKVRDVWTFFLGCFRNLMWWFAFSWFLVGCCKPWLQMDSNFRGWIYLCINIDTRLNGCLWFWWEISRFTCVFSYFMHPNEVMGKDI